MVRFTRDHGLSHHRERSSPAVNRARSHTPAGRQLFENSPVGLVVVDNQHPHASQRGDVQPGWDSLCRCEGRCEVKLAANTRLALHPNPATHECDQPCRNSESQASPAEPACHRGIRLRERLENHLLLLWGNAHARIHNREAEAYLAVVGGLSAHAHHNLAGRRELDGVPENVDQHLTEAARIADDGFRNVRTHVRGELEAFSLSLTTTAPRAASTTSRTLRGSVSSSNF